MKKILQCNLNTTLWSPLKHGLTWAGPHSGLTFSGSRTSWALSPRWCICVPLASTSRSQRIGRCSDAAEFSASPPPRWTSDAPSYSVDGSRVGLNIMVIIDHLFLWTGAQVPGFSLLSMNTLTCGQESGGSRNWTTNLSVCMFHDWPQRQAWQHFVIIHERKRCPADHAIWWSCEACVKNVCGAMTPTREDRKSYDHIQRWTRCDLN